MLKTKALKPSHREKKRYIVYELSKALPSQQKHLVAKLELLLGVFMSAQAGIMPLKFLGNRGLLRVNHTAVDYVKACFTMIHELNGTPVTVHSVIVSGMINKANEYLQPHEVKNGKV